MGMTISVYSSYNPDFWLASVMNYWWCDTYTVCKQFQIFRPRLVNDKFLKNLGLLLNHLRAIDSGSMQIQGATGKPCFMSSFPLFYGYITNVQWHSSNFVNKNIKILIR